MVELLSTSAAALLVLAHQVGSAAFNWAIVSELSLLLWIAALFLGPRWGDSDIPARRFRLAGVAAAFLAAVVALIGKLLEVWPGNPLFPSGHTAYAVTIAVFLAARDRRWLPWVPLPLGLLFVALVLARYHVPMDIVGGVAVGATIGGASFLWLERWSAGRSPAGDPGRA